MRVSDLIQKSRKAVRLYSGAERMSSDTKGEHSDTQVAVWREINSELLRELQRSLEQANLKKIITDVFSLRDRFLARWRCGEADLHIKQKDLIYAAENGDFVKSALLSTELLVLKATVQACEAVTHELNDLLGSSRPSAIELTRQQEVPLQSEPRRARVIPLPKPRASGIK